VGGLVAWIGCAGAPRHDISTRLTTPEGALPAGVERAFALTTADGLSQPLDLVVDPAGRLLVLDGDGPDILVYDEGGRPLDRWSVSGSDDRWFFRPSVIGVSGLAVLLMDQGDQVIRRFDLRGQFQGTLLDLTSSDLARVIGFIQPADFVADEAGQVYITDREGHRVLVFDSSSRYVRQFGTFGAGAGQLRSPDAISVDPAGGLYVADIGNHRVQGIDGFGTPLRAVPIPDSTPDDPRIAVDVASLPGDVVLIADDRGRLTAISPSGRSLFSYHLPGLNRVAVGADGRIFVLAREPARVEALDVGGL